MKLNELVHSKAIRAPLDATKRDASIGELMKALVTAKVIKPAQAEELVKAVLKRERKGSTGFGHGMAVPHAKTDLVDAPIAALGISPVGIDFSSLDRQPVNTVFLILSPEAKPDLHVAAMEAIFQSLQDDQFKRLLRQARTPADARLLLQEAGSSKG
ncbi:MAG: PTS sugar transporter subunit IIA [Planctomycetes bacterium]|nr:PTS sugar transporter subunit IIA [Planctomycetota bacterium]